jgi:hypothetical protein
MSFYSQPNYYQSLLGISSIDAVNSNTINTQNIITNNITVNTLGSGLVSSNASGSLQNSSTIAPLSYNSTNSTLSITLTGSTGINYQVIGNTGYISNSGLTSITSGATGPVYISTSSTGSVHIALPQNITTSSSPQFARLLNSSIGTFSVIQGTNSGNLFTGDRCVLIGDSVMSATSASQQSTAIGNSALGFASGNFNTAVGSSSGFAVTTGTTNTIVGTNAGRGTTPLTTGSGNVLLGAGANTSSASSSNEIVLGFGVGAGSNTAKIYASNGLNVSNLTTGVLKATSGTITSTATTDDLTEGKTNLYFTNARAQGAFTAGTGIDISSGIISNTSLTGTTGPIGPIGFTGPIGPIGPTGFTGPIGVPGVGGTIGYYANYYSTTTQSIGSTAQQITFPNFFVQNGISLDVNNNITFSNPGTYKISTLLQVNGSNNAKFYHWYRYNGVDVANSAFEDHFSSGAGQVLSTSSGLITVVAGDKLGLWGVKTAGTIEVQYTPGSVSPAYPASTSVNIVVSQETYTQIGPTGYTGATGPIYTAGTNIDISGTVISTSLYPQFASIRESSIGTQNVLLNGFNFVDPGGAGGNTLVGSFAGYNVVSGGKNIAVGLGSLFGGSSPLNNPDGQNIGIGTNSLGVLEDNASYNVAIGPYVGPNVTTGNRNLLFGQNAGGNISTSNDNLAIGNYSMGLGGTKLTNVIGNNVAVGNYAGYSINATGVLNTMVGPSSGYYVTTGSYNCSLGHISLGGVTSGSYNVALGQNTLTGLTTGSNNVHIGSNTQSRVQNAQRAIVISAQTTTAVDKGDDTAFINAPQGLYYYNPAICYLYGTGLSNGRVQWNTYDTNNVPTKGFYLANYGNGANTVIVPNVYGHYEITINGAMLGNGSNLILTMNNVNVRNYNIWYQSYSSNGIAYSLSATAFARPYTVVNSSGFEFQLTNMTLWGGLDLFVCIKFIGF